MEIRFRYGSCACIIVLKSTSFKAHKHVLFRKPKMFMKTKLNDFTVKGGISEQGSPIKLQNQLTVPVPTSLLKSLCTKHCLTMLYLLVCLINGLSCFTIRVIQFETFGCQVYASMSRPTKCQGQL